MVPPILPVSELVLGVSGNCKPGEDDEVEPDSGPQSVRHLRHRDGAELGSERDSEGELFYRLRSTTPSACSGSAAAMAERDSMGQRL